MMKKRVIVKEFLEHIFQYSPDEHVRGAYKPNPQDKERKVLKTPAAKLHITKLKKQNKKFKKQMEENMDEKENQNIDEELIIQPTPISENNDKDNTLRQTVTNMSPPHDYFGRFKRYMESNYEKLREVTKMAVKNLNKLIDYNYYPTEQSEKSNRRHRPIGIGVQGLADVFALLRLSFDSDESVEVSRKIAEHMYLAAVEASMEIAKKRKKYIFKT